MNCEACRKSFTGIVPYTQHIKSEKHRRKMNSMNILGISNQIVCTACNITFDSVQSYHHHSLTLDHANNVSKNADKTLNDQNVSSVSSDGGNDNIATDSSSHDQNLLVNNESFQVTECKICNKKFIDQVTYLIHLESAEHKKNIETVNSNAGVTENISKTHSCDLCNKVFTGPEPFVQHLLSAAHTKKTDLESNSNATKAENTKNKFTCEPCKKIFTGQIPYNQHLSSSAHKKKLKLLQLPEQTVDSKSDSEHDSSVEDGIKKDNLTELKNDKPWFCKFCHIQCSGLIPYKQHLEGDTHFKNTRVIAQKPKNIVKCSKAAKDNSVHLPDVSSSENSASETLCSVDNEVNESIELDLSQVTMSLMPSDDGISDISLHEFFSDERPKVDECKNEKDANEDTACQKALKEVSDDEFKDESPELSNKQLANEEDASCPESSEHVEKGKSKRLHSTDENSTKKLRSK